MIHCAFNSEYSQEPNCVERFRGMEEIFAPTVEPVLYTGSLPLEIWLYSRTRE